MLDLSNIRASVDKISIEVGQYLLNERKTFTRDKVEEKSFNNLVSYVDKTAEDKFKAFLKELIPEAGFIAEESEIERAEEWNCVRVWRAN